jgi:hypothetical protein
VLFRILLCYLRWRKIHMLKILKDNPDEKIHIVRVIVCYNFIQLKYYECKSEIFVLCGNDIFIFMPQEEHLEYS